MNHDDNNDEEEGSFVLARWHVYFDVKLMFVSAWQGKPVLDGIDSTQHAMAYKWKSYHAARKYQRAHPCLSGYVIMNLSEIRRMHAEVQKSRELVKFEPH